MFKHIPVDIEQLKRKNTEEGRRYITPSGVLYPSITTILSHKSKPFIDAWKKRVGEKEANKITRQATSRGTSIHKLVEYHLNNDLLKEQEGEETLNILNKEMYLNLKGLLSKIDNIRCLEQNLYSDHLRLAGQVDCIAEYEGELAIIDFKTSAKPKPREWIDHYFVQCMAYGCMLYELTGISVKKLVIIMACENGECVVYEEYNKAKYIKLLGEYINKFIQDKLELYGTE